MGLIKSHEPNEESTSAMNEDHGVINSQGPMNGHVEDDDKKIESTLRTVVEDMTRRTLMIDDEDVTRRVNAEGVDTASTGVAVNGSGRGAG